MIIGVFIDINRTIVWVIVLKMSQSKQKTCREGCGATIYLSDKSGSWLPYNLDDSPHRCRSTNTTSGSNGSKSTPAQAPTQQQMEKEPQPVPHQCYVERDGKQVLYQDTPEGRDFVRTYEEHEIMLQVALKLSELKTLHEELAKIQKERIQDPPSTPR